MKEKVIIALLTNNDDDVYCFRKELIEALIEDGYDMNDYRSKLALDSQAYKIAQFIGQYFITLCGLDALVFTGGVGENGIETRQRICEYLKAIGVEVDSEANNTRGKETKISSEQSKVDVWVIPTDEELMIARDTMNLIK